MKNIKPLGDYKHIRYMMSLRKINSLIMLE